MSLPLPPKSSRRRSLLEVALLLAVVLLSGACDQEDQPADVFFPTWIREPGAPVPTGDLAGGLVERNGCLIWSGTKDVLPLWPDTFQLNRADVTIATNAGVVLAIGDSGTLGGGERTLEQAESVIGKRIPGRCQPAGGYWMVTDVLTE